MGHASGAGGGSMKGHRRLARAETRPSQILGSDPEMAERAPGTYFGRSADRGDSHQADRTATHPNFLNTIEAVGFGR
jgi:hypothetical protein